MVDSAGATVVIGLAARGLQIRVRGTGWLLVVCY